MKKKNKKPHVRWKQRLKRRMCLRQRFQRTPTMHAFAPHAALTRCLQYDEEKCVTASDVGPHSLKYWDMHDLCYLPPSVGPTPIAQLNEQQVRTFQYENERNLLVHSSGDTIKVQPLYYNYDDEENSKNRRTGRVLVGHRNLVWTLHFEKECLATGSRDHRILVWDLEYGKRVSKLKGHGSDVRCLRLSHDTIVSAGDDGQLGLWDKRKKWGLVTFLPSYSNQGWACQFDEDKVMCNGRTQKGGDDGVLFWDRRKLQVRLWLSAHQSKNQPPSLLGARDTICFARYNESLLLSSTRSNELQIWEMEEILTKTEPQPLNVFHPFPSIRNTVNSGILHFQFDEDKVVAACCNTESTLFVLDFDQKKKAEEEAKEEEAEAEEGEEKMYHNNNT
ncbi:Fbox domain containing protein [Balamuthia mandrillaris]